MNKPQPPVKTEQDPAPWEPPGPVATCLIRWTVLFLFFLTVTAGFVWLSGVDWPELMSRNPTTAAAVGWCLGGSFVVSVFWGMCE